jgi:putative inorganic carbon (hco3(-)) transporter
MSARRNARPAVRGAPAPESPLPFRALMAFTFILLLAPQSFLPFLAPLRIALVTAVLAVATYALDRYLRRQPVLKPSREIGITGCLLVWIVLTLPFSYWPGGSLAFLLDVYLKTLLVFWLLGHVVSSLPRLRQIAWGLTLMAVPLAVSGFKSFVSGGFMREDALHRIAGYTAPLTENPNDLALMLNLILPLSVALLVTSRGAAARSALLAFIGLDAIAIIVTFSRAGFLTLAVTLATYMSMLLRRRQRGGALLIVVLALAAAPFLPSSYLGRLATITDIEADSTGSAQERWSDMVAAVKYAAHHPVVGAGLGMNALAMNEARGATWKEVHNVYLQYAVELGLPGLILFLMLLAGCIKGVREKERECAHSGASAELGHFAAGIRVSLTAFAVAAMFHPAGYQFYFYYIAGLAMAVRHMGLAAQPDRAQGKSAPDPVRGLA